MIRLSDLPSIVLEMRKASYRDERNEINSAIAAALFEPVSPERQEKVERLIERRVIVTGAIAAVNTELFGRLIRTLPIVS